MIAKNEREGFLMDLNIKLEHADAPRCFAVNVDPEGCTCQPAVNVQIGGKARGWASLGQVLPLGWTRDDYNRIVKSWVDEHQRPNTATQNRAIVLEKIRRDWKPPAE
jgi:hypothetical protein